MYEVGWLGEGNVGKSAHGVQFMSRQMLSPNYAETKENFGIRKYPRWMSILTCNGGVFIHPGLPISTRGRLISGLSIRSSRRAHFSRNSPFSFQSLRFSSINESRCSSTFSSLPSSLAHRAHGSETVASGFFTASWWPIGVSLVYIGPRPKMSQSVFIPKVFVNKSIVAKFSSLLFFS